MNGKAGINQIYENSEIKPPEVLSIFTSRQVTLDISMSQPNKANYISPKKCIMVIRQ